VSDGQLLDVVEARFDAILINGRSVGVDGAIKSIPAGDFRKTLHSGSMLDPAYSQGALDRSVEYDWSEIGDGEDGATEPSNPRDPRALSDGRCHCASRLDFGRVVRTRKVRQGHRRREAGRTARGTRRSARSRKATAWRSPSAEPDLFTDPASEPRLTDCFRRGRTTVRDLPCGGIASESRYVVTIDRNQNTPMRP
jgi:hypothetical protein